ADAVVERILALGRVPLAISERSRARVRRQHQVVESGWAHALTLARRTHAAGRIGSGEYRWISGHRVDVEDAGCAGARADHDAGDRCRTARIEPESSLERAASEPYVKPGGACVHRIATDVCQLYRHWVSRNAGSEGLRSGQE